MRREDIFVHLFLCFVNSIIVNVMLDNFTKVQLFSLYAGDFRNILGT